MPAARSRDGSVSGFMERLVQRKVLSWWPRTELTKCSTTGKMTTWIRSKCVNLISHPILAFSQCSQLVKWKNWTHKLPRTFCIIIILSLHNHSFICESYLYLSLASEKFWKTSNFYNCHVNRVSDFADPGLVRCLSHVISHLKNSFIVNLLWFGEKRIKNVINYSFWNPNWKNLNLKKTIFKSLNSSQT